MLLVQPPSRLIEPCWTQLAIFFETGFRCLMIAMTPKMQSLAAAALLFEAAMSDYDLGGEERSMIQRLVREQFDLSDEEAGALTALAQERVRESTGLHGFTSLINQHWSEHHRLNWSSRCGAWFMPMDGWMIMNFISCARYSALRIPQKDFVSVIAPQAGVSVLLSNAGSVR